MTVTIAPAGSWGIATCTSPATELAAVLALPGSWPIGLQPQCFVRNDQWAAATTPAGPPGGYAARWDASQITGVADGAALASWPDLSGNAHDLSASGANRPTYYKTTSANLMNGQPTLLFDGANSMMRDTSPYVTPAQPYTICAACRPTSSFNTNYETVVGSASFTAAMIDPAANKWAAMNDVSQITGSATAALGQSTGVIGVFNGGSSSVWVNGTSVGSGNLGATALNGLIVGARSGASPPPLSPTANSYWRGLIGEVLIYPSALSAGNITSVTTYFHSKWGTP
jgi:hypothetical protein